MADQRLGLADLPRREGRQGQRRDDGDEREAEEEQHDRRHDDRTEREQVGVAARTQPLTTAVGSWVTVASIVRTSPETVVAGIEGDRPAGDEDVLEGGTVRTAEPSMTTTFSTLPRIVAVPLVTITPSACSPAGTVTSPLKAIRTLPSGFVGPAARTAGAARPIRIAIVAMTRNQSFHGWASSGLRDRFRRLRRAWPPRACHQPEAPFLG